jgi:hypothetical protein
MNRMKSKQAFIYQGRVKEWGCCFLGADRLPEEVRRLKIRGHRGGGNKHFCNFLKINLFSVSSVVGF